MYDFRVLNLMILFIRVSSTGSFIFSFAPFYKLTHMVKLRKLLIYYNYCRLILCVCVALFLFYLCFVF